MVVELRPPASEGLGGPRGAYLAARLPVLDLALGSVAALVTAASRVAPPAGGASRALVPERVAASFASDRLLRLDGEPVAGFAPLSGFFRTADGWVRTHANYPHHRARLLAVLALPDDAARADVERALGRRDAQDVEDAAVAVGAIVARVRTEAAWFASAPGRAASSAPLVLSAVRDDVLPAGRRPTPPADAGSRPLSGVRVLDLTRVIAGPVATRALALLGADVLRVDPPVPAELAAQHLDTGQGKRTTLLDLAAPDDRARAQALLDDADVLVTGYRPGAIEAFGLRLPPGVVHARVNAWGDDGPWAGRRGFDSIVQAACGIALVESPDGERPGALPAQALDHASGYLLAAAIVDALADRAADGRGRDVGVALARTAAWLLRAPGRVPGGSPVPVPGVPAADVTVTHGSAPAVTTARPAVPGFDDYPFPAHPWGSDPARW